MKRLVTLLSLILFVAVAFDSTAQMSRKEAKEWKKRIKALDPEEYKNLIEEHKSLKNQVSSLKSELAGVDDKLAEKDDQISQYQSQITSLKSQVGEARKTVSDLSSKTDGGDIDESKGVVFKVQIGAFAKKDLSKYMDNARNFNQEQADNLNKFTLGVFRDYWAADTFKKYLREMGVKDAWIVSYKEGQRVPIKEVLEGVTRS